VVVTSITGQPNNTPPRRIIPRPQTRLPDPNRRDIAVVGLGTITVARIALYPPYPGVPKFYLCS